MSNKFTKWMGALLVFVFCAFASNAQTTLLTEDFENWPLTTQGWSFLSYDPATGASIAPPSGSWNFGATAHTGSYSAYHDWWANATGAYPAYNDWMVSPAIDLTTATNPQVSFWQYTLWAANYAFYHDVSVSTVDPSTGAANWMSLWQDFDTGSDFAWDSVSVDLSAFIGQTIWIGFNYQGQDGTEWMIDDVSVIDYVNQVFGCTDSTAYNFDLNATDDDGSCVWLGSDCSTAFTAIDGVNTATAAPEWWVYYATDNGVLTVTSVGSGIDTQLGLFSNCFAFNGSYMDGDLGSNDDYGSFLFNEFESELTINVYMGMPIYIYWADGVSSSGFDFNVSFTAAVLGCTDSTALNYNAAATQDDGSCFFPVFGCTDQTAFNYDPFATSDDSSCTYCNDNVVQVSCDGGAWQTEVSWSILASDGSILASGGAPYSEAVCLPDDCYTIDMIDSFGDGWNGNILDISDGSASIGSFTIASGSSNQEQLAIGATAVCTVLGCTDSAADNYDPNANTDDGSCTFLCTGTFININCDGGSFQNEVSWTLSSSDGTVVASGGAPYNADFCLDSTDCYTVDMADSWGDGWNGNMIDITSAGVSLLSGTISSGFDAQAQFTTGGAVCAVFGCIDSTALNYDSNANTDDGSCLFSCVATPVCADFELDLGVFSQDATDAFDWSSASGGGTPSSLTGPSGDNTSGAGTFYYTESSGNYYNSAGLTSQCLDVSTLASPALAFFYHMYGTGMGTLEVYVTDASGVPALAWSQFGNQGDQWNLAQIDLSTYSGDLVIQFVGTTGVDFYSDMAIDDVCIQEFTAYGCTDSTATNYDANATDDDGSCFFAGCTFAGFDNYDPTADTDDGSCVCSGSELTISLDDSFGDGWNGNVLVIADNTGAQVFNATLATGSNEIALACLPEACDYTVTCDGGSFQNEVSWTIADTSGAVLASGTAGAGLSTDLDLGAGCQVFGCTDSTAANYDASATDDDGSCAYCADNYVTINVDGGSFQNEVSWTITSNSTGAVVLSGGAPFDSTVCLPDDCYDIDMIDSWGDGWNGNVLDFGGLGSFTIATGTNASDQLSLNATCFVYGCTDATAVNYDPAATADDGSCQFSCTAAPYTENFDSLSVGTWSQFTNDNLDWILGTSTSSTGTGPQAGDVTGGEFLYIETSGVTPGDIAGLASECFDISALASPCLSFSYHMYGADMGTLDVFVNANLEYTATGDQGDQWNIANIDLSAYAGTDVNIVISGTAGASFTSDMAIDAISIDECQTYGCTDSLASNYDAAATSDDGTCYFLGCTSVGFDNYDPMADTDDGSCFCSSNTLTINLNDTWGDGWNGNVLNVVDTAGTVVASATLDVGSVGIVQACIPDGCNYTITCDGGSFQNEVSWTINDTSGFVLASGGAGPAVAVDLDLGGNCAVFGCTDSTASNYDMNATDDDGSCCFDTPVTISVDGGSFQNEVSWTITSNSTGAVVATGGAPFTGDFCLPEDCYDIDMVDSWGDGWNGNVLDFGGLGTFTIASGTNASGQQALGAAICYTYGCMDSTAVNFDPAATADDGSCQFSCTAAPYAENFDAGTGTWTQDATDDFDWASGSSTPSTGTGPQAGDVTGGDFLYLESSGNYGVSAGLTSECFDISALVNPCLGFQYNMFGADMGTLEVLVNGDTLWSLSGDQGADWQIAQVSLAAYTGADITVQFVGTTGASFTSDMAIDAIVIDECIAYGCTDPLAPNYDANATVDDGSCAFYCNDNLIAIDMIDSWGDGWNGGTYTITDGTNTATGGLTSGAAATDSLCLPDGCYDVTVGGGSFDGEITFNFGSLVGATAGTYTDIAVGAVVCGVSGCTDSTAANYDAAATVDDGSCVYCSDNYVAWSVGGGSYDSEVSWSILDASGTAIASGFAPESGDICLPDGCYTLDMVDSFGDGWNGASFTIDGQSFGLPSGANATETFCLGVVAGCTDPAADNYDASATTDDGSCTYPCLDNEVAFVMIDSYGDGWNGATYEIFDDAGVSIANGGLSSGVSATDTLCIADGCYSIAVGGGSYDSEVSFDFGSLVGAAAGTYDNIVVGAGSCGQIFGCTDSNADNYDASATDDDGSCSYCSTLSATATVTDANPGMSDGVYAVTASGGTSPYNVAYPSNPMASAAGIYSVVVTDAEGCTFTIDVTIGEICLDNAIDMVMIDSWGDGWNGGTYTITDGTNTATGGLTTGATATDGLCLPTGCYTVTVGGGSYDSEISFDFGSLVGAAAGTYTDVSVGGATCGISGCTDPAAANYDAAATVDDGSCVYCSDNYVAWSVGGGSYDSEVSWSILDASGTAIASGFAPESGDICLADGCYTLDMVDSWGDGWNGASFTIDGQSFGLPSGANATETFCLGVVAGCTDPAADNYDASATTDDGSCTYPCLDNEVAIAMFDSYADGWNGGTYTITDGTNTATGGLTSGAAGTDTLCLPDGCYDVTVGGGAWDSEISFDFGSLVGATAGTYQVAVGAGVCAVFGCTDASASNYDAAATDDDGNCLYPFTFVVDMNCAAASGLSFTTVYASGPFNGWSADANPLSDADGDGVWEGTYDLLAGDIEYKYQVDMWADQEDLIDDMVNGGTCAPVTDYWSFANRMVANAPGGVVTDDNYGSCDDCDPAALAGCTDATADNYDAAALSDDGSCLYTMTFEVDMNCAGFTPGVMFLTGPADGWSGSSYAMADADGDGVWSGTFQIAAPFEYIYTADYWAQSETAGLIDAMVNGGTCAPNTDYFSYANRMVTSPVGGSTISETWGSCADCIPSVLGCTDANADNFDPNATVDDGSCTYAGVLGCTEASASNYNSAATTDDGSCLFPVTFTVDMNCYPDVFGTVYVTGPSLGWCADCFPLSDADGDGVWEGTGDFPAGDLEYKYQLDQWAHQEDLVDDMVNGGTCAPVTDYFGFANRLVSVAGATVTDDNYGSCDDCVPSVLGCTDANADNYDASADTDDGSCTYCSTFALSIDSQSDASATGASDGTAIVTASGGTSPYSINWPADPNALAAGTYTVTATDAEGCTTSIDITIDEPSTAVCSAPTGLNTYDVVHTRATFNFTSTGADYYKIRVKENGGAWAVITQLGTATGTPGGSTKTKYFLTADASYEWQVRAWCIDGQVSGWSTSSFFNTLPACPNATNQYASDIEAEWAVLNWDAPTNTVAGVNYYLARIQEDGASAWNIVTPANGGTDNFKLKGQLIPGATYNFETRTWCNTGDANNPTDPYYKSDWGGMVHFQTIPCPVQTFNLYTSNVNATTEFFGADFIADANVPYDHFTLRFREVGATAWQFRSITAAHIAAGGRNVGGLTTGAEYEWGIRTFCGTGSTWKSPWGSGANFVAGGSSARLVAPVTALEVYPNPSRDIFNVSFTSEEAQTINVKVVNLIGEVVYTENLEEFTGQYTNIVDMNTQPKGVYFLEITTNTGGINKKIVLQ